MGLVLASNAWRERTRTPAPTTRIHQSPRWASVRVTACSARRVSPPRPAPPAQRAAHRARRASTRNRAACASPAQLAPTAAPPARRTRAPRAQPVTTALRVRLYPSSARPARTRLGAPGPAQPAAPAPFRASAKTPTVAFRDRLRVQTALLARTLARARPASTTPPGTGQPASPALRATLRAPKPQAARSAMLATTRTALTFPPRTPTTFRATPPQGERNAFSALPARSPLQRARRSAHPGARTARWASMPR